MSEENIESNVRQMGNQTFIDERVENILVVTRGHPFERDPFFEMIDSTGYCLSLIHI